MKGNNRRSFIKFAVAASLTLVVGGLASLLRAITPASLAIPEWPELRVANEKDIEPHAWYIFTYPSADVPCLLVRLGLQTSNSKDIVSYCMLCQHARYSGTIYLPPGEKRSPVNLEYLKAVNPDILKEYPDKDILYCPAHGALYDLGDDGKVLSGPPFCSLSKIALRYDEETGDVFVSGMTPPAPPVAGVPQCSKNPQELERVKLGRKLVTEITLVKKS